MARMMKAFVMKRVGEVSTLYKALPSLVGTTPWSR
jgi:hypothetical protein